MTINTKDLPVFLFDLEAPLLASNPFAALLAGKDVDPAAWAAAFRQHESLGEAERALAGALLALGWTAARRWMMAATMPANWLFTWLGDGVDFDEGHRRAAFTSPESAAIFAARFPQWEVASG